MRNSLNKGAVAGRLIGSLAIWIVVGIFIWPGIMGVFSVTANRTVRQFEARARELERQLGRKTLEVEILKEALDKSRAKKTDLACALAKTGRFAMSAVAAAAGG